MSSSGLLVVYSWVCLGLGESESGLLLLSSGLPWAEPSSWDVVEEQVQRSGSVLAAEPEQLRDSWAFCDCTGIRSQHEGILHPCVRSYTLYCPS